MLMGSNDPQEYYRHYQWDNSTYQAIADVGNTIINTCMPFTAAAPARQGGMERAGKMRRGSTESFASES